MVYGTGAEEKTRKTCFYGIRLDDDDAGPAGELVIRQEIGDAPFREAQRDFSGNKSFRREDDRYRPPELFDPGNSLLILEDGSAIISAGRVLVRIRDAKDD